MKTVTFSLDSGAMRFGHNELKTLADVAVALGTRYFAVCTVLLHPYTEHVPRDVFSLFKLLSLASDHQICVSATHFTTYSEYLLRVDQIKCSRTMNIVFGDDDLIKNQFIKLTFETQMAGPLWLIFLNNQTKIHNFLEHGNLPFDVDLVVAQLTNTENVVLHEAYRASLDRPVRVLSFGNWSEENGLISPNHISLYYRRMDFEGISFKVATAESYPIVSINQTKSGTIDISGYFANIWHDLESRLNFSSMYLLPQDNTSGMLRNGTWSGLTGMVAGKTADMGVGSLTISEARSRFVDFLRPLITTRNTMFLKKPGLEIRWTAVFRPFETGVWVTLLVWILLGAVFLNNSIRLGRRFHFEPHSTAQHFTAVNSFFCLLRVFSQQGSSMIPIALPGRILVITSYLVSVVILTAYSGALISFIAVQVPRMPFHSLEQFVQDGSYQLQVVKDSAEYMYFANASEESLNAAYRLMTPTTPRTMEEALNLVCNQRKLAHFGPKATMDLIIQKLNLQGCDLIGLPNELNIVYLSIIIQKRNQYRDALNHHLDLMIYQGLLGRLRKQLWPTLGPLRPDTVIEVRSEQVIPIYMILLGGVFLAWVMFVAEILKKRKNSRMKKISIQRVPFTDHNLIRIL